MIATFLLLALVGAPANGGKPLARVDSVEITRADVTERIRVLRANRRHQVPSAAVSDLVDEALLAAEARRQGLDGDPPVVEAVEAERRRLAVEALVARMAPEPTEARLLELFHQTSDSARLVLVKVASEQEARDVLERLRKGADAAAEARRSVDPNLAARGGDTGLVSRAALDAPLAEAVFRAKPGDLVGPVQLRLGWAVARVVERQIADEAGFPARRAAIAAFALERARAMAKDHVTEQLKRRSGVKLDEEFVRRVGAAPSEKELAHPIAVVNGRPIPWAAVHGRVSRLGTAARTHGAGAARIGFAWEEVERRLLEDEALGKGLDRSPEVVAILPAVERNLLAGALAAKIAGRPAGLADPAVKARVSALRASARVTVDSAAVAALDREAR